MLVPAAANDGPALFGVRKMTARLLAFLAPLLLLISPNAIAQDSAGAKLLESKCSACHARVEGGLQRIKDSRRTPEGWDMNLVRMMVVHGIKMTGEERAAMVKYLSDNYGLAPEETDGLRYILERRSNMVEPQPDDTLAAMCARCHSYARFALQRRTRDEWLKLMHFHLGQFPTAEYQAMARDRNWWEITSTEMPDVLAKYYPLETDAWTAWQSMTPADPSGEWRIAGHQPGLGGYHGTMTVTTDGDDQYAVKLDIRYQGGDSVSGSGRAIVYTGYEWRASIDIGGRTVLQVAALDKDAANLSGRWFYEDNDVIGADLAAVKSGSGSKIMAVQPGYLKVGQSAEISVHGTGLSGDMSLGDGVEIVEVKSADASTVVVTAMAAADAAVGARSVKVGDSEADGALTIYNAVDSVAVEPAQAIARVGDTGGPLAPVPAQFDAVAYLNGPDGAAGTDDDIRIGVMPARWSVANNGEVAAQMQDTSFSGSIDAASGLFMPAGAGPNPDRTFSTNNAGDLMVNASVMDDGKAVEGSAHLIVTVQRWNDPPIR